MKKSLEKAAGIKPKTSKSWIDSANDLTTTTAVKAALLQEVRNLKSTEVLLY